MFFIYIYFFISQEECLSYLLCRCFMPIILFIDECTELGDSNVVTKLATDKRLAFNVLLFYMKNILRLMYANVTVLEQ